MPDQSAEERDQLQKLTDFLTGTPVGSLGRLPVQPRLQELPFNDLSWEAFEQLCWRLIEREPGRVGQVALYGGQGDTQEGIDIFARRVGSGGVEEAWVYQCKNYRYYPPSKLETAIKEFKAEADQFVVIFASSANSAHRKIQREQANLELWDKLDLSRKLKDHPDLVADFFGVAWVRPFCDPQAAEAWLADAGRNVSKFIGTVFDDTGHPFVNASVRVISGDDGWVGTTGGEGLFEAELIQPAPELTIIASHHQGEISLSGVSAVPWEDAQAGAARVHLRPAGTLSASIRWLGKRTLVEEASVIISLLGSEIRRPPLTNGHFRTTLPVGTTCELELTVPGAAVQPMKLAVRPSQDVLNIYVARACAAPNAKEVVLVQHICDDFEIEFASVPGADAPEAGVSVPSIHIGRFPVTCAQYGFYLQHESQARLPERWSDLLPPPGREEHPVTGISWHDARSYCEWLTSRSGVVHRLPTAGEWLRAAGGDDGRLYPWGDADENLAARCNSVEDNINQTTAVERYPAGRSPYGLWDMVGNVWEWVDDAVEDELAADVDGIEAVRESRIACGGSYLDRRTETNCRSRWVLSASQRYLQVGFRVLREHSEEN